MDLTRLTAISKRYLSDRYSHSEILPNLSIYQRTSLSALEAQIYEPVLCLILQGSKVTSVGDQHVDLRVGDALVVSHDLPVVSRITRASPAEPYIALILTLDLGLARGLYEQVAHSVPISDRARSLSAWQADPVWVAPLTRYLELMENPLDAQVLGPSILREIHYRLLSCPIGGMLRHLLVSDSHASRVANAIHLLRREFRAPLSVSELATQAGMSASSFHEHFKSVTGTTPLQYQKDLRLIEARALRVEQGRSVSETAYAVGYESPTHFSRDYSKKFGVPPSQDRPSAHPALH